MRSKNIFSGAVSLALAAAAVTGTLVFALPNAGAFGAFLERGLSLLAPAETAGFMRLGAHAPSAEAPAPQKPNMSVPPLEEPEETASAETAAPAPSAAAPAGWETPQDLKDAEKAFLETAGSLTPAGEVRERFFETDGATWVQGNVAVRNCAQEHAPDFAALLGQGAPLEFEDPALPLVLVFHTHTTESYLPAFTGSFYGSAVTRSTDPAKSVVRVGEELCEALRRQGIGFIHDTEIYDETYNGAYARSRERVLKYLEEYPSIRIVLDVHRDALYASDTVALKPTAEIMGRKAAQVMIITGVQEGPVTDFPGWEQNLRFALSLQQKAQALFEGLMKPVFFCRRRYNMDVSPCGLLLEFGSDSNTTEEAAYAGRLLGEALAELIKDHDEKKETKEQ